jgi:hypothetical protein
MALRALRKAMIAFATFDSVAACRACATQGATQNVPSSEPQAAPPEPAAAEGSSGEASHAVAEKPVAEDGE